METKKVINKIIEEIESYHFYKTCAEKYPENAQYYNQMAQDEIGHANYMMRMHPNAADIVNSMKKLDN